MEYVPDIKKVVTELCDRALVARAVREYMRETDNKQAYSEWTAKWMVMSDVLVMLTGRDILECLTERDLNNIKKEYEEDK